MDPVDNALYFYVSYARLGPLPTDTGVGAGSESDLGAETDPDSEVETFFTDLDAAVGKRIGSRERVRTGFYDRQISYMADPRQALSEALGRAQTFLPLYSPNYLVMSWTRREQDAFRFRMSQQGHRPDRHILPVLWTPVPEWTLRDDDRKAVELARGLVPEVAEYAENGLRALCVLDTYADAYRRAVQAIAARIVRLVQDEPVESSPPLDLTQVKARPTDDPSFVVAVFTAARSVPAVEWHPYAGRQDLPVAEYVTRTAERLGLSPQVVDFAQVQDLSRLNPALVVVDPGLLAEGNGEADLSRAFADLPTWVRPMVIGDGDDGTVDGLAHRAQQLLSELAPVFGEFGTRAVERVDGPRDLEIRLPLALAKARQTYLTYGPYSTQVTSMPRLRLSGGDGTSRGQESDAEQ